MLTTLKSVTTTDEVNPMTTKLNPIHPGEVLLCDLMEPLGISQNALAKAIGVEPGRINAIVNRQRSITGDTALRLARYFNTTPDFWINLQKRYELQTAKNRLGDAALKNITPLVEREDASINAT